MHEARDSTLSVPQNEAFPRGPMPLGPSQRIDSPERVRLELELAGPMSRAFAYSIDYSFVLIVMAMVVLFSVSGLQQAIEWASNATFLQDLFESLTDWVTENEAGEGDALFRGIALAIGFWMVFELLLTTVYFVFFETLFAGRTPGKKMTRLRVVTEDGAMLDWKASMIRNLLRAVDSLPAGYLVGVVAIMLSPRAQRLGDMVAGTLVVRERATDPVDSMPQIQIDPDIEAGFRFTRNELLVVGEVERRLIRRTLRRAEILSDRAARPIVERATQAMLQRIGREGSIPTLLQRDFLSALLQASDRLL